MLSEEEFFRFVEEKVDNLNGYADAQTEVGHDRKDIDELLYGYPYSLDEVTYKAYKMLTKSEDSSSFLIADISKLPEHIDINEVYWNEQSDSFEEFVLMWIQDGKSCIQRLMRGYRSFGVELTPLQLILCSSALLQEK